MALTPEYLDVCTLRQACHWIAFGKKPMSSDYEEIRELVEDAVKLPEGFDWYGTSQIAEEKLRLALIQKKITATGRVIHSAELLNSINDIDEYVKTLKSIESRQTIDNIGENVLLNLKLNRLTPDLHKFPFTVYHSIRINFADLENLFPKRVETRGTKSILSKDEIAKVMEYADTQNLRYKNTIITNCAEWAFKTFGKTVNSETMRGYLKPYFANKKPLK